MMLINAITEKYQKKFPSPANVPVTDLPQLIKYILAQELAEELAFLHEFGKMPKGQLLLKVQTRLEQSKWIRCEPEEQSPTHCLYQEVIAMLSDSSEHNDAKPFQRDPHELLAETVLTHVPEKWLVLVAPHLSFHAKNLYELFRQFGSYSLLVHSSIAPTVILERAKIVPYMTLDEKKKILTLVIDYYQRFETLGVNALNYLLCWVLETHDPDCIREVITTLLCTAKNNDWLLQKNPDGRRYYMCWLGKNRK